MRRDFHALVDSLTDHQWNQRSITTRWSNGELLTHFVMSLGLFPKELACARQGKSFVNLPGTIMNPLNLLAGSRCRDPVQAPGAQRALRSLLCAWAARARQHPRRRVAQRRALLR